jgi:hypothetical protein
MLLNSTAFSQNTLPEALRIDLKCVEETWRILDKYSEQVWPGWKNYTEIPFRIDYPNGLSLEIGEPRKIGKFKRIDSLTLRGKNIYLDNSRLNSVILTPRLYFGGGGAGGEMYIKRGLITTEWEQHANSLIKILGNSSWPREIVYSTDQTIISLVHELFHCFVNFFPIRDSYYTPFESDLNYAVFAEIEGGLLEKAAFELDTAKVKNYLKESLIVRQMKRCSMSERQREYESDQEKCEGTAMYTAHRIVQLLKNGYTPGLSQNEDPLYYGFRYCDYFPANDLNEFHKSCKDPLNVNGKNYANGFFKCLILDKLIPNWKNGFFENKISFDQLIVQLVDLKEDEQPILLVALKKEYRYEELVQHHSPVIAERDSIIRYFQNNAMNYYIVNIKEMAVAPIPNITSSGTYYRYHSQHYYSSGITNITEGDMTCNSQGISICYNINTKSIILPNTDSRKDGQGYDLKCSQQNADSSYSNVTITSKSFTLHATKLRIIKSPTQVEFRIMPAVR